MLENDDPLEVCLADASLFLAFVSFKVTSLDLAIRIIHHIIQIEMKEFGLRLALI